MAHPGHRSRPALRLTLTLLLAAVAMSVVACGGSTGTNATASQTPKACNGSAALCTKRLDEAIFPGTHNSYAASDEPGWHFANQRFGIGRQLQDGIRALLIDVHFGVYDAAHRVVRTDLRAEGSDRNKVAKQIGPQALRFADLVAGQIGVGSVTGEPKPYLCHTLCELGSEPLDQELEVVRRFLDEHPAEVLIVIVEPYVPPAVLEQAFERTGLLRYAATLDRRAPMPTLGDLVRRGRRLVVFAEEDGGTPAWYMPAFSFIQDTPLGARLPTQLSCRRARGEPDSPLLLINHWIDNFPPRPAQNRPIGRAAPLRRRIQQCTTERGVPGAIVAVDFHQQTDVVAVARQLNR